MKRGFTVIEVLVVLGIIGILTAVILPSITGIRAKNRDTEKVADIAAIQLALSLYYNQHPSTGYPAELNNLLSEKYITADSLASPNNNPYVYVPLKKGSSPKCTYYHLGVVLELPSAQIDTADNFSTLRQDNNQISSDSNGYDYCGDYGEAGLDGADDLIYDVHP